jgi:hypothetical protein
VDVENQAIGPDPLRLGQEAVAVGEGAHLEAFDLEDRLQRIAHRRIVVDDRDCKRLFGHSPSLHAARRDAPF